MFKIITQEIDKKRVLIIGMVTIQRKDYYVWYRRLERFFKKFIRR